MPQTRPWGIAGLLLAKSDSMSSPVDEPKSFLEQVRDWMLPWKSQTLRNPSSSGNCENQILSCSATRAKTSGIPVILESLVARAWCYAESNRKDPLGLHV
eukprot:4107663-Amphidinium_carterae.1